MKHVIATAMSPMYNQRAAIGPYGHGLVIAVSASSGERSVRQIKARFFVQTNIVEQNV